MFREQILKNIKRMAKLSPNVIVSEYLFLPKIRTFPSRISKVEISWTSTIMVIIQDSLPKSWNFCSLVPSYVSRFSMPILLMRSPVWIQFEWKYFEVRISTNNHFFASTNVFNVFCIIIDMLFFDLDVVSTWFKITVLNWDEIFNSSFRCSLTQMLWDVRRKYKLALHNNSQNYSSQCDNETAQHHWLPMIVHRSIE